MDPVIKLLIGVSWVSGFVMGLVAHSWWSRRKMTSPPVDPTKGTPT